MVEEAVFDRLGRPSFFAEVVEAVMGRIAARIEHEQTSETANSKSTLCAFAPQESGIRELAEREAQKLKREIKRGFVEKGILTLPGPCAG
jgi:hypothetical protein